MTLKVEISGLKNKSRIFKARRGENSQSRCCEVLTLGHWKSVSSKFQEIFLLCKHSCLSPHRVVNFWGRDIFVFLNFILFFFHVLECVYIIWATSTLPALSPKSFEEKTFEFQEKKTEIAINLKKT
jgi:hypothetical protein